MQFPCVQCSKMVSLEDLDLKEIQCNSCNKIMKLPLDSSEWEEEETNEDVFQLESYSHKPVVIFSCLLSLGILIYQFFFDKKISSVDERVFYIIGGVVAGAVVGFYPLLNGLKYRSPVVGIISFFAALTSGAYFGILLAAPLAVFLAWVIKGLAPDNNESETHKFIVIGAVMILAVISSIFIARLGAFIGPRSGRFEKSFSSLGVYIRMLFFSCGALLLFIVAFIKKYKSESY